MMKTSEALYEAIEGVKRLETAMAEDHNSPDTHQQGVLWIQHNALKVYNTRLSLEDIRDSLNEGG